VRPDAAVGDYGVLGARCPQRDRSTMNGCEPDPRTVSRF
jgi:hypothetical protein